MWLKLLGPMSLSALAKKSSPGTTSGFDPGSLLDLMKGEKASLEKEPKSSSLIGRLVEPEGDGDFDCSDMSKMASNYWGKMFRK